MEDPAIVEEFVAAKEPRAMEEIGRVKIDDPPQPEVASASLMIPRKGGDATGLTKHYDANPEIPECSTTTGLIGGKTPIIEAP